MRAFPEPEEVAIHRSNIPGGEKAVWATVHAVARHMEEIMD